MKKLCVILTVLFATGIGHALLTIDDFASTNPAGGWSLNATALNTPVYKAETGLSGVYGGSRDTTYVVSGTGLFGTSMTMGSGYSTINNGSSSYGVGTLDYNGGGGGLGLDLTSGTKLSVDTWFDHVGFGKDTVMSITLDDGSQTATVSKVWTTYLAINFQQVEDFLFSAFLADNASIDLSSIDSIQLYLETDMAGDYAQLNGLVTDAVPEPATMALLALGGLLIRKRK